jgi:hypothetical protein
LNGNQMLGVERGTNIGKTSGRGMKRDQVWKKINDAKYSHISIQSWIQNGMILHTNLSESY